MSSFSQPKNKSLSLKPINKEINQINIEIIKNNNENILKTQNAISNMIDVINDNNLNLFYKEGTSKFKYNIDQLNLKFYLETEKILSSPQSDLSHYQNRLFLILFKQINLYIKEIERLNLVLIEESKTPKFIQKKVSILDKKKNDFETKESIIQSLKYSLSLVEKKLSKVILSENKIKQESEKLKKELSYYKELYQKNVKFSPMKKIENETKRKSKRTNSDNNQNGNLNNEDVNNNVNKNRTEINLYDKSPYKKSTSKLKIIKTVKNKISNNNNRKSIQKKNSIQNITNLNCYNNNSNNNFNYSLNNIHEDINKNYIKIKKQRSSFNSNNLYNKNGNYNFDSNKYYELYELNQFENLLYDIKNYIIVNRNEKNYHSMENFNNNIQDQNQNNFIKKRKESINFNNNHSITPQLNSKIKISSNGALDQKIM